MRSPFMLRSCVIDARCSFRCAQLNSNVGGACGEIVALKGKYFRNLYVFLGTRFAALDVDTDEPLRDVQDQPDVCCDTEQAFRASELILRDLRSVAAQNFEYKMSST